jgi:glycosyltransferase involved in cell wall biosynthesis
VRICVVGKFPPIQGGVSMRTYWTAHALAMRGHDVHVVTNANEVRGPFRMHMRPQDWKRCEAAYGAGSVTVHWSDPVDRSQSYIPMASPFVSKLAAIAARVHSEQPFDVIYSHYMEPYGVAGHLAAQIAGIPHVARMAGSDAGRLWRHPQLETLYDHVLRTAEFVVTTGPVAERAIQRRADPNRIVAGGGFVVPEDLFTPEGPTLDLAQLSAEVGADPDLRESLWGAFRGEQRYFGICGKLGERKGSWALLAAMHSLKQAGVEVGLVALAHGDPPAEKNFRARARKLGLVDRILQIPFLPHWRVPEFLRGCVAVCCLEQNFPILFHTPIIPREVLLCGACLVGSTEVIRKLPLYGRLVDGYGCVAIEDVNDVERLSQRLAAIAQDATPALAVGARGRSFARELQQEIPFPQKLECILQAAAERRQIPSTGSRPTVERTESRFSFSQLAATAMDGDGRRGNDVSSQPTGQAIDLAGARKVFAALEQSIIDGNASLQRLVAAMRIEIAVAAAEEEADASRSDGTDPLFRLRLARWALDEGEFASLVPLRAQQLCVVEFDFDVSEFRSAQSIAELPEAPASGPSYIVVFGSTQERRRQPLLVDAVTARILRLSDGTRTVSEIIEILKGEVPTEMTDIKWIENLFLCGLICLQDEYVVPAAHAIV